MIQQNNTLTGLAIGESGIITAVGGEGALRQHFLDMGLIPGVEVSLEKYAPMGDPMQLKVAGYELTLRVARPPSERGRKKRIRRQGGVRGNCFSQRHIS